jgi:hypothetical protein
MGYFVYKFGWQLTICRWISSFVWSFFFSNDIPWQYIAIRIAIRLLCIAIYRNTLLPYRDTPTYDLCFLGVISKRLLILTLKCNVFGKGEITTYFLHLEFDVPLQLEQTTGGYIAQVRIYYIYLLYRVNTNPSDIITCGADSHSWTPMFSGYEVNAHATELPWRLLELKVIISNYANNYANNYKNVIQ